MLSTLNLTFYRRIVYKNCHQQLTTKSEKKPKITYGFSEFNRDTQSLSCVKLKKATAKNKADTKILKKILLDFEPDTVLDSQNVLVKQVQAEVLSKKNIQKKIATKNVGQASKPIVFKPPAVVVKTDKKVTVTVKKNDVNNMTVKEIRRKEIEDHVKKKIEESKLKVAERCLKTFDNFCLNEDFLQNILKYPLISENLRLEDCSGNFYDEIEFKIAGERLFSPISDLDERSKRPSSFQFPAVTTVINEAMPENKRNLLIEWEVDNIEKRGFDGFEKFQKKLKMNGANFHKGVEGLLKKQPVEKVISEKDEIFTSVKAIEEVLKKEFNNEMILIEDKVFHSGLFYNGRIDCLGYYKDRVCLIDWKRSEKPKKTIHSLYDAPIQTSAYIGAFLNDPKFRDLRKQNKIKNALIVNVSVDGDVNFHLLNYQQIEFYWYQWLSLLKTFWHHVLQQRKN